MPFRPLKADIKKRNDLLLGKIEEAYKFAERVHRGQKRKSGEPYITHPVEVARIVNRIGGDENMICAALLHDTIEDADDPQKVGDDVYHTFGGDVYYLVDALSKDFRIEDKKTQQETFFAQLQLAAEMDVGVFFIKLADLMHNMGTISSLRQDKRDIWVEELKEHYIPFFQQYFHKISLHYHGMYHNMMDELQGIVHHD